MKYRYSFRETWQVPKFLTEDKDAIIILPANKITKEIVSQYDGRLFARVDSILWPGEGDRIKAKLEELKTFGLKDVYVNNIGAIGIAKDLGFNIHGGSELNIFNSEALEEYKSLGLVDATMSIELSFSKMKKIKASIPIGFIGYGFLPLMKYRACPKKSDEGCGDCKGFNYLTDRTGAKFPMICNDRKYSELLNCVPVYVADKNPPELSFVTLDFTFEEAKECEKIIKIYKEGQSPDFDRTGGLYFRNVQ